MKKFINSEMFSHLQLHKIEILIITSLSKLVNAIKTKLFQFHFQRNRNILITLGVSRILPYFTQMATKWKRINLQSIVIPIWNPENKGYKIGFEKRCWNPQKWPKNGTENFRILFADSVLCVVWNWTWCTNDMMLHKSLHLSQWV